MRIKTLALLCFLLSFSGCKKAPEETVNEHVEQNKTHDITEQDVKKIKYIDYILDSKTEDAIKDWQEYKQLETLVANIKKADLTYFTEDKKVLLLLLRELKQNLPDALKAESINSRILVMETQLLKLESLYSLSTTSKAELIAGIKEFLIAFSNLNFQMNKKVEFDSRVIEKP
ncbi:hypothetical protein FPF71_02110 [Algibacter amylolyticus]|uniref:Lipoprotein n=1 Tax=Algibacter amylolyticus TaxID=1608400 RepID=A0A5M7BGY2_9FLAO|nr:hypothetical protein [Algibacter amylolyticus]KAA5827657.1 hypothetical protein F2B50_02110 [Algibacter amylolyticus]MBB5266872.1 hypothetical protein [Algibacter amylolyticus]TSJ81902.1 hypothetical protein FPF71_02110 [Algibacter amylolyticus]